MSKILTIVIPAYNVADYIEQCLNSLVKNRIEEIEVLVIDDGSKDDTYQIAKGYEDKYPEVIKAVHKENGGHGSTINKGLELATGKYFRVLDGDDWFDEEALEKLLGILNDSDSDLVLTDVIQVFPDNTNRQRFFTELERGRIYDLDKLPQIDYLTMGAVAVKTDILKSNKVHITEKCYYVDIEYNTYCLAYSHTIQIEDLPLYMYRLGNSSQSTVKANMYRNIEMLKKVSLGMANFFENINPGDGTRKELMLLRIGKLVRTTMLLYLADSNSRKGFNGWKEYRELARKASGTIYKYINNKWMVIRIICTGNRLIFKLMSIAYKHREM